jgi:hypothetical protein
MAAGLRAAGPEAALNTEKVMPKARLNGFQRTLRDLAERKRWERQEDIRLAVGLASSQPVVKLLELVDWLLMSDHDRSIWWNLRSY